MEIIVSESTKISYEHKISYDAVVPEAIPLK
jgi:hypothetical protein